MLEDFIRQSILFSFTFLSTLFASVSGGGAGLIQFPLLIILGLPFSIALGTHKVAAVFLGIGAICKKGKQSTFSIDKTVALIMVLVGGSSVVLGSLLIVSIRTDIAQISLGLMIILCGFYSLIKKGFGSSKVKKRTIKRTLLGALTICIIGLFSGSLSSGAGLFTTITLVTVFGLELKRAIMHTMIFVSTLWNGIGAITIGAVFSICWQWLPCMIIAAFLGSYLGTSLLIKMPDKKVKLVFSLVSILSGVLLIMQEVFNI